MPTLEATHITQLTDLTGFRGAASYDNALLGARTAEP
jgi:hypothetical protein